MRFRGKLLWLVIFTSVTLQAQKLPESKTKIAIASYTGFASNTYKFKNQSNGVVIKFSPVQDTVTNNIGILDSLQVGKYYRITYRIDYIEPSEKKQNPLTKEFPSPVYERKISILELKELPSLDSIKEVSDDGFQ